MAAITYRPDIDGLRAIAVVAVVLYHFGIGPVHGGFVGVDVFFVISGYLITKIIHRQVLEGRFSFATFYDRRIRRIFPALFVMLGATMGAALFIQLPSDLENLSGSAVATLLFVSNILFWRRSGYFDPSAEFSPVLHTWSLAVEEQFYIFFPIFLLLAHRLAPRALAGLLAVGAALSFALCLYFQARDPSATFYLAPFRAWELALGSLLAVGAVPALSGSRLREAAAATALAVLLGSLWWTEAGAEFPGWQAAFPVVATAALIHLGSTGPTLVHRLLATRPFVFVGLISYSLYLWHWPLVVFVRYRSGMAELSGWQGPALLVAALLLAWASYRWVETPFRVSRGKTERARQNRRTFGAAAAGMAILALAALTLGINGGWRERFGDQVLAFDQARHPEIPFSRCDGRTPDESGVECAAVGNRQAKVSALLWGDSHALAWAPAFGPPHGLMADQRTALAIKSACPPLVGVGTNFGNECRPFNDRMVDWIRRNRPDTVFLVASWTDYSREGGRYRLSDRGATHDPEAIFSSALLRTVREISPFTRRIVLVGPTPGAPVEVPFQVASAEARHAEWPKGVETTDFNERSAAFWRSAAMLRAMPDVELVDPRPWFCKSRHCAYSVNRTLLYRDDGHLSRAGARFVAAHAAEALSSHALQNR